MSNKAVLVLMGMPGSGKTTLGKALAQKLRIPFRDLDVLLEEQEGCTIPELFERKGEEYFRKQESTLLKQVLAGTEPLVLATGGGTPCFFDNIAYIGKLAQSVYLEVAWPLLAQRLALQPGQRPLLKDVSLDAMSRALEEKFGWRIPYYEQADIKLSIRDGQSAEALTGQLLPLIGK
ncbi:shikimate kinase [Flammeovirgaceae bacterium 311]|nr:shikimate kinase [Flammeovirgaceae bacterium 311]